MPLFDQQHVALVCGGTAPIGTEIAVEFARAGVGHVVVAGRDSSRGATTVAELSRKAPSAKFAFMRADLADETSVDAMFDSVRARYGALDSYVHCVPPGGASGLLDGADLVRFQGSLTVGLGGLANACRLALRLMKVRGGGSIITFASDAGRVASAGHSLIASVQSAIMALTRSLALEVARDGVRVNCISPTYVRETPLFDRLMRSPVAARAIEQAAQRAGLGLPSPTDIAPLATFLASPAASKITGQVISVNGGLSAA
jgi:NAD(P)-dependent dehydrogenase (short-subunit alcohol dehydrogenase family)